MHGADGNPRQNTIERTRGKIYRAINERLNAVEEQRGEYPRIYPSVIFYL